MSMIRFAKFDVTSQVRLSMLSVRTSPFDKIQVFHRTAHSFAVVNLKPLLPGHVLVCPINVKLRLADLTKDELNDLFQTVQRVQHTLTRLYKADAFNVAVQDGKAAGQSVPHVHCHVIPRQAGDAGGNDKVHEWLEGEEGDIGAHHREQAQWAKDGDRHPRSQAEMDQEAAWLAKEMAKDAEETKL